MKSNRKASMMRTIALLWVGLSVHEPVGHVVESDKESRVRRKPFVKR